MKMTAFHALLATALIACSLGLAGLAQAADNATAPSSCVPLASDPQIVRAGDDASVLLHSDQAHYIVHFRGSCPSVAISRQTQFQTGRAQATQLCADGSSRLKTDRGSCPVARIEAIDAGRFEREVRRRTR
ncbi:hypothetical protein [Stenotrophomonas sp. 24(2023)]|uniref:hypothetical protein n=1 Tax=Stenotrophomonas sp. 24(2023) TaxID=3068324 RepID=UPI0027E0687D|nr:hypothetical protein [Stenotrophomonas sp. 24(2023)]WMJ69153.1 hypothetical protein Q9R17_18570 [Stenotrophomonas sp. 24(2023)]